MKTIVAGLVALTLAGSASAGVGDLVFGLGMNMFRPNISGAQVDEGQNFMVGWAAGSGLVLGVYFERTGMIAGGYDTLVGGDTLTVRTVQLEKSVTKTVAILARLGAGTAVDLTSGPTVTGTAPLYDVGGRVTILTASGEVITGTLVAIVSARFCNPAPNPRADGANVALVIQVGF